MSDLTEDSNANRFDFIVDKQLREMLDSDYAELRANLKARSWKSVQVISGSIIEAVLVDYIMASPGPATRPKKDSLKMDLAEAVEICKNENVLTERASQLCSVVRGYRNLIHPGRAMRLKEQAPTESSATIAQALVDMILREVAEVRRETFGLTAEQVLNKLENDPRSLTMLPLLLQDVRDTEKDRLVTSVLHGRILQRVSWDSSETDEVLDRLDEAYKLVRDASSDQARRTVFLRYVKVLKEDSDTLGNIYDAHFFFAADLEFATPQQIELVKHHFLDKLKESSSVATVLSQMSGIERYMTKKDAGPWIDALMKGIAQKHRDFAKAVMKYADEAVWRTPSEFDAGARVRLVAWRKQLDGKEESPYMVALRRIEGAFTLLDEAAFGPDDLDAN